MILEALKYLITKGEDAKKLRFHKIEGDQTPRTLIEKPDGTYDIIEPTQPPIQVTLGSLNAIVQQTLALVANAEDARTPVERRPTLHYWLNQDDGDSTLRFRLYPEAEDTECWADASFPLPWVVPYFLQEIPGQHHLARETVERIWSVDDAVKILDRKLRPYISASNIDELMKRFGVLKVIHQQSAESQQTATSSFTGGVKEARVEEVAKMPASTLVLDVPVTQSTDFLATVPLTLQVRPDLEGMRWFVFPLPNEAAIFQKTALNLVRQTVINALVLGAKEHAVDEEAVQSFAKTSLINAGPIRSRTQANIYE